MQTSKRQLWTDIGVFLCQDDSVNDFCAYVIRFRLFLGEDIIREGRDKQNNKENFALIFVLLIEGIQAFNTNAPFVKLPFTSSDFNVVLQNHEA